MSKLEDEYAVNTTNIQQGVQILKRRQTHLMAWCIFTTSLAFVALISYFLQQEILTVGLALALRSNNCIFLYRQIVL